MIPAPATGTFVLTVGIEPTTAPLHPRSSAVCVLPDPQDGARETYPSPDAVVYDRSIFPVPAQGSTPMTDIWIDTDEVRSASNRFSAEAVPEASTRQGERLNALHRSGPRRQVG